MKDHYRDDTTMEALMFSYILNEHVVENIENTCIGIKVKLILFLFLNEHHARVACLVWVSKQTDTFRSAWQMQPLAKFILCRVSRGRGSNACTFSYE